MTDLTNVKRDLLLKCAINLLETERELRENRSSPHMYAFQHWTKGPACAKCGLGPNDPIHKQKDGSPFLNSIPIELHEHEMALLRKENEQLKGRALKAEEALKIVNVELQSRIRYDLAGLTNEVKNQNGKHTYKGQ